MTTRTQHGSGMNDHNNTAAATTAASGDSAALTHASHTAIRATLSAFGARQSLPLASVAPQLEPPRNPPLCLRLLSLLRLATRCYAPRPFPTSQQPKTTDVTPSSASHCIHFASAHKYRSLKDIQKCNCFFVDDPNLAAIWRISSCPPPPN